MALNQRVLGSSPSASTTTFLIISVTCHSNLRSIFDQDSAGVQQTVQQISRDARLPEVRECSCQ